MHLAEAGRFSYDADDTLGPAAAPMIRGFDSPIVQTNGLERFSCPTDFGKRYARRLQVASDVKVLLGANCTAVRLEPDGRSVRELEVATLAGTRLRVAPRAAVLAAGGLETTRLLLASRDVAPAGIGNEHDVVGRYYMCHVAGNVGNVVLNGRIRTRYAMAMSSRPKACTAGGGSRSRRANSAGAAWPMPWRGCTSRASPTRATATACCRACSWHAGSSAMNTASGSTTASVMTPGLYARHLLNVITDPVDTTAFLAHWVTRRTFAQRKFPSVILRNRTNRFSLEMHGEQAPRADSRVTLCEKTDALGMPQLRIDWRYSSSDIESVGRTLDLIAQELERSGAGRLDYRRETLEEDLMRYGAYGGHHIGTARMGSDVRTSVVDSDCRVHSVRNLFVAGSSVFPTSGQANPTLTLIALSLRLGKHLCKRLEAAS